MEFQDLFTSKAMDLGIAPDNGLLLSVAVEPICKNLAEIMDLGIYFHSVARCEELCSRHGLPEECAVILWAVCSSLRERLEGSIAVESISLSREIPVSPHAIVPFVGTFPLFGGEMNRSVAPGAVTR